MKKKKGIALKQRCDNRSGFFFCFLTGPVYGKKKKWKWEIDNVRSSDAHPEPVAFVPHAIATDFLTPPRYDVYLSLSLASINTDYVHSIQFEINWDLCLTVQRWRRQLRGRESCTTISTQPLLLLFLLPVFLWVGSR